MDILHHLATGFAIALTPTNILYCFIGVFIGTMVGVLPGIGATVSIAILAPITVGLGPTTAIIMLAGIYYGAMYGGSTTAILINIPGEAASVATSLDGYQMARQGQAGPALGISAIASFVAGTLSLILLMTLAVPLASYALAFGPPEYFSLMTLGLTIVVSLVGKSMAKGLLAGLLGMLLATIGMEPVTGQSRFTFGSVDLMAGIDFVAVVVGLFAIPEVLENMEGASLDVLKTKLKNLFPTREDLKRTAGAMVRSSIIGFFIGVLPGSSGAVAAFMAYNVEQNVSKHPERFGKGAIEGVAASEGANNAAVNGAMVPLLSLGIPVSAPMAVLLGAFMLHGLKPGPMLFDKSPEFVWALIASMYIGNVLLLVLNLPLVGLWAQLIRVPYPYLAPGILVLCLIGAYGIRNSFFDVGVAFGMGIVGYLMKKLEYPTAPVVLALILSPMLEDALRQSLTISKGSVSIFVTRPISLVLLILAVISVAAAFYARRKSRKAAETFLESNI
ncbi:MAG: tripartite tricarboxylate transporter permease [Deltaproteobacteria bacterium]|nr:tripartite tricarboxylate transporter permease [Deltaproteobacteria bacterium]